MEVSLNSLSASTSKSNLLVFTNVDNYDGSISPEQFDRAGQCFLDLARDLDRTSDRWLHHWLNPTTEAKDYCVVAHDWNDWLESQCQQSVSVRFLDKYDINQRRVHDYPNTRESWLMVEDLAEVDLDFGSTEAKMEAISLAHEEKVQQWSELVEQQVAKSRYPVTFKELTHTVPLRRVEIYLGILLGDRFILSSDDEDFYGGFLVSLT